MKKQIIIRIPVPLCEIIKTDLDRPHQHAFERVGFVTGKSKQIDSTTELICLSEYFPVADENYLKDDSVGARINSDAIREAMQLAMDNKCSIFHIHKHFGWGTPGFSTTDLKELPSIAQAMVNANPNSTHGVLLLSDDNANAVLRMNKHIGNITPSKITIVGHPLTFNKDSYAKTVFDGNRYSRQSFLGNWAQRILSSVRVGIVGLGGGGSHIVQQLAHVGVLDYVIFDDDFVSDSNLNRLVGATLRDVRKKMKKTLIAKRLVKGIQPKAKINLKNDKWQEHAELLHSCDIVFGAVDSFAARRDLELDCRRYLIPYIDIGMDVRIIEPEPPRLYGQVILSMPGEPCMHCMGFLTEDNLAKEAARYGDAGVRPQVVWSNGILASTAVGIGIDVLTGWSSRKKKLIYQEYDGNGATMSRAYRLDYLKSGQCQHFPLKDVGPVVWK